MSMLHRIGVSALVLAGAACLAPEAKAQSPEPARFVSVSPPTAGRVHLDLELVTPDDATFLRVREVTGDANGVDIVLEFEKLDVISGPEVQVRRHPLTIDRLPVGSYPLRLTEKSDPDRIMDQVMIEVPAESRLVHPLPVAVWPAAAGLFDDIWLLIEPPGLCDQLELQAFADTAERIFIQRTPTPCTDDAGPPRLSAIPLGPMSPQDGIKQLLLPEGDDVTNSLVGAFRLQVMDRLSSRLGGHWFNPEQSGHGIDVQMLAGDLVSMTWFVFDQAGNTAWLTALGTRSGSVATMNAVIASGGRFPPDFDAGAIVRQPWGVIEIEFESCDSAIMRWQSDFPDFNDGELPLVRLTANEGHDCSGPPPESALVPDWYQGPGTYFRLP